MEGTRTLDVVADRSTVEHGWNEPPDGTVIDATARVVDGLFDDERLLAQCRYGYDEQPVLPEHQEVADAK